MIALSRPLPEAPTDRRNRQLDYFRRAADKCMRAVDIASEQLETAHASGEPGATASPTFDLARSTRALVLAVNAENRVVAGVAAPRAPASDRRRTLLRAELHKIAKTEPDPKRRATLHNEIEERVEETLLADPDPDSEIDVADHLYALADQLHLTINPAKLSDEILGIEPIPEPGANLGPRPTSDDTHDPWDDDTD